MTFGTLHIVEENDEEYFQIESTHEIELMIKRMIPSHKNYPLKVKIHSENTQIIKMVMGEFPFDIMTDKWEQYVDEIKKKEELAKDLLTLDYVEPDSTYFIGKLRPFQKLALDFLQKTGGNTLIADEMGLGKTIETLAFIAANPKLMPVVVVAPLVTLINWKREIEKFLKLYHTQDNPQHELFEDGVSTPKIKLIRNGSHGDLPSADFYLINYELVGKRIKDILNVKPKIVVYDEVHNIRNDYTRKYEACNALSKFPTIQHRIGLSGTPIYNSGIEIFNICEVLKPGLFGDRSEFIRKYCMSWEQNKSSEGGKSALKKLLSDSIMIRRKKINVLDDLPEKIRIKQTLEIDTEMYDSQIKRLVDDITQTKKELESLKDTDKEGLFELNKKIRGLSTEERQIAGMAKAPFVVKYITELLENYKNEKFVVFCHHQAVRDTLLEGLSRFNPTKVTGGQSDKERQNNIDNFQNGDSKIIICGLRSGSLGINLTSSAYVIFAELDWTPSVHRQAEDRIHRIGQKRQVFAHYLEGAGTFDEELSNILLQKSVEINGILGDRMEIINNKKALEFLQNRFHRSIA